MTHYCRVFVGAPMSLCGLNVNEEMAKREKKVDGVYLINAPFSYARNVDSFVELFIEKESDMCEDCREVFVCIVKSHIDGDFTIKQLEVAFGANIESNPRFKAFIENLKGEVK